MTDLPARELRNDVSGVLRRVEAGERLRVTVSGRPVTELIPLSARPETMSWKQFESHFEGGRADAGLTRDLSELLPDSTDDVPFR
ncbi:MAG: type II toxin-antitoxin system Phd/YefM family antitoxin [Mycobacteriales bacterium]